MTQENALEALREFDRILRNTEAKGVKVVPIEALRVKFDGCMDKFQVFASDLTAWNMDVLNG